MEALVWVWVGLVVTTAITTSLVMWDIRAYRRMTQTARAVPRAIPVAKARGTEFWIDGQWRSIEPLPLDPMAMYWTKEGRKYHERAVKDIPEGAWLYRRVTKGRRTAYEPVI